MPEAGCVEHFGSLRVAVRVEGLVQQGEGRGAQRALQARWAGQVDGVELQRLAAAQT